MGIGLVIAGIIIIILGAASKAGGAQASNTSENRRIRDAFANYDGERDRAKLMALANKISLQKKLDPRYLRTIGTIESNWKPDVIGDDRGGTMSLGLMQLHYGEPLRELWKRAGLGIFEPWRAFEPQLNISLAANLLIEIQGRRTLPQDIFSEYNAGPIDKSGAWPNPEYVNKAMPVFNGL